MQSQINKLISSITRALGGSQEGGPLRETNIINSLSPDDILPRPFKPLPNVSALWMRTNRLDPLLSKFGVAKKLSPQLAKAECSWKIKAANRYLSIMYYRLEKLLKSQQPNQFWVLSLELMKRSRVLRAIALRKLDKNWHRNFKFGLVKLLLRRLQDNIVGLKDQLDIVRQYEDKVKADGTVTYRPVGNPAYVDRMYMYLWQSFMVMYVGNYISKSQHGFLPGRGVLTAVKELKTLMLDAEYKYAWEFDLKGAFPSVNILWTMNTLRELGCPAPICEYLKAMSIKTVERVDLLPEDQKGLLPEPKFERQLELEKRLPESWLNPMTDMRLKLTEHKHLLVSPKLPMESRYILIDEESNPGFCMITKLDPWTSFTHHVEMQEGVKSPFSGILRNLHSKILEEVTGLEAAAQKMGLPHDTREIRGFPQGSGLSPILFDVAFEEGALRGFLAKLHPDIKVLSYADDFIVFSKVPLPNIWDGSEEMKAAGLEINKEKSRIIKSDGAWLVPKFKYLGLTFHTKFSEILLEGTPRSGNNLMFDKMNMVEQFIFRDRQLAKIARVISPEIKFSPQDILDQWGNGEFPARLIPAEVILGDRGVTAKELEALKAACVDEDLINESSNQLPKKTISDSKTLKPTGGNLTASEKTLLGKFQSGKPLTALGTRIAGMIVNRLHGGGWQPMAAEADRSLKPHPSTGGTSWIERIRNLKVRVPSLANVSEKAMQSVAARLDALGRRNMSLSIYNSTSHATHDLLTMMRRPKDIKSKGKGFVYR